MTKLGAVTVLLVVLSIVGSWSASAANPQSGVLCSRFAGAGDCPWSGDPSRAPSDGSIEIGGVDSGTAPSDEPDETHGSSDADSDPAPDAPQGWTEFVPFPVCGANLAACQDPLTYVCDSYVADYEQRLAADPTIPKEDWVGGYLYHYAADGITDSVDDEPVCRNVAPAAPTESEPPQPPPVTAADVEREFKTVDLPRPVAQGDPAFPGCLFTHWDNFFYVSPPDDAPIQVTVLGTAVTIYPTAVSYEWDFGDGATLTTTDPGGPAPDGSIVHRYDREGHFRVTVATHWEAEWEAPGHARSAIAGATSTRSAPADVWVHDRRIVLVSDPDASLPPGDHDPADACYQS